MDFPVDHLSASSITTFLRCPRQWQAKYVHGLEGPSNSALLIGSAVHDWLAQELAGEDPVWTAVWEEAIIKQGGRENIVWKDKEPAAEIIAFRQAEAYYHTVGRVLNVLETEKEISVRVPGVPIPVVGFIDIVCPDGIIDVKTTGYLNAKSVQTNREWTLQANIYQLAEPKVCEFHVITRSKDSPLVLPPTDDSPLVIQPPKGQKTEWLVKQVYEEILFMHQNFGEHLIWRGGFTHPWAGKYCPLRGRGCCQD